MFGLLEKMKGEVSCFVRGFRLEAVLFSASSLSCYYNAIMAFIWGKIKKKKKVRVLFRC